MPSIITILWTQSGGKRGSIESLFILSTFLTPILANNVPDKSGNASFVLNEALRHGCIGMLLCL